MQNYEEYSERQNVFWNFYQESLEDNEKIPIFATSNVCFDYAAECGEQGLIDTAPFESHLPRVAFFIYPFEEAEWNSKNKSRNLTIDEP